MHHCDKFLDHINVLIIARVFLCLIVQGEDFTTTKRGFEKLDITGKFLEPLVTSSTQT
jgi:hypothetical protein